MENKKGVELKFVIIIAVVSLILGALIMFLLNNFAFNKNKTVIGIKGYKLTKLDLYEKMKKDYALSYALQEIDNKILADKYPLSDDEKNEIEEQAKQYLETYEMYGYSKDDFLKLYGFNSYEDFVEELTKSHRQEKFYLEHIGNLLGEDTLQEYYNTEGNIYGDINCKHILVQADDDVTEEQAKELATTIISELDAGASWDDIIEKYSDQIIAEDLGYQGIDNSLEQSFMDALIAMDDDSYSKEPVKTSYGYHVIYRMDSLEKPTYDEARNAIINKLSSNVDQADLNSAYIKLEEEYGLKIYDKELEQSYKDIVESYQNSY